MSIAQAELFQTTRTNGESSSTFQDNLKLPVHRWFRYSAGFSAAWVSELLKREKLNGRFNVFDPFAGSGTVLIEGEACGINVVGIDSHPFVSRIAQAKLYWKESPHSFQEYAIAILRVAQELHPHVKLNNQPILLTKCFPIYDVCSCLSPFLKETQMQNNQWQWVPWVLGLLGGGAMGAIITAFINYLKNRRQPVGYRKDIVDIFRKKRDHPKLAARLLVREHPLQPSPENEIDTLFLARLSLTNLGNQDLAKFTFGITTSEGSRIIDMRMKEPDRHHVMKMIMPDDRSKPLTELDFTLEPFNRREKYNVSIYFTYGENPIDIKISSPHPTDFINLGNMTVIAGMPLRTDHLTFLFSSICVAAIVAILLIAIRLSTP